jgi:DNA-binding NtrC family response regulator
MVASVAPARKPRLLLLGLQSDTAGQLARAFPNCQPMVAGEPAAELSSLLNHVRLHDADIVFCPAGHQDLPALLQEARKVSTPIVVVSEHADTAEWLDAMDAGAADYAAPPFNAKQLNWIVQNNLKRPMAATSR